MQRAPALWYCYDHDLSDIALHWCYVGLHIQHGLVWDVARSVSIIEHSSSMQIRAMSVSGSAYIWYPVVT